MPQPPVPNVRLRALLDRAGWTGQALADAVNRVGAEAGMDLRYDRTAVAHWLSGTRPTEAAARFAAEALTRRTGSPVTAADAGLERPREQGALSAGTPPGLAEVAAQLRQLADVGRSRGALLQGVAYSLAASVLPAFGELPPASLVKPDRAQRVGATHAQAASLMLELFSESDAARGGGHARPPLTAFLGTDVADWLRSPASPRTHSRLLAAAADLAYLAGFACFDDQLHAAAQRYYLSAAELARAAGDPTRYAIVLRGMSVQALALGHRHEAWRLASTAADGSAADGAQAAFLVGQLAVASAGDGDHRSALRYLAEAERLLARRDTVEARIGAYHQASLAHQQAETLALLGDTARAVDLLDLSLRHRPPGELRSRAVTRARLAELRLRLGHVEHACADWNIFLDDLPRLRSGRADAARRTMRALLRPHSRVPAARALLARSANPPGPASPARRHD